MIWSCAAQCTSTEKDEKDAVNTLQIVPNRACRLSQPPGSTACGGWLERQDLSGRHPGAGWDLGIWVIIACKPVHCAAQNHILTEGLLHKSLCRRYLKPLMLWVLIDLH